MKPDRVPPPHPPPPPPPQPHPPHPPPHTPTPPPTPPTPPPQPPPPQPPTPTPAGNGCNNLFVHVFLWFQAISSQTTILFVLWRLPHELCISAMRFTASQTTFNPTICSKTCASQPQLKHQNSASLFPLVTDGFPSQRANVSTSLHHREGMIATGDGCGVPFLSIWRMTVFLPRFFMIFTMYNVLRCSFTLPVYSKFMVKLGYLSRLPVHL